MTHRAGAAHSGAGRTSTGEAANGGTHLPRGAARESIQFLWIAFPQIDASFNHKIEFAVRIAQNGAPQKAGLS